MFLGSGEFGMSWIYKFPVASVSLSIIAIVCMLYGYIVVRKKRTYTKDDHRILWLSRVLVVSMLFGLIGSILSFCKGEERLIKLFFLLMEIFGGIALLMMIVFWGRKAWNDPIRKRMLILCLSLFLLAMLLIIVVYICTR